MSNKIESIQVLGSGCPTCKNLYETVKSAAADLGLGIEVEYVNDIEKMVEMGIMSSPALAINGQPVIAGRVPDQEKIKELIKNNL
jgi:small redox-active disulfide protein 2